MIGSPPKTCFNLTQCFDSSYSHEVRNKTRQIVAVLLAVFLVNALCWSVSPNAFADWLGTEQGTSDRPDIVKKSTAPAEQPKHTEKSCNEGCHACCHFHALNAISFELPSSTNPDVASEPLESFPGVALSQPRRPPRIAAFL